MRILMITPAFPPSVGGAETGAYELARRLALRNSVTLLTEASRKASKPEYRIQEAFTLLRYQDFLNFGRIGGRMLLRGAVPPFSIGATLASIRTIMRIRPELVHVHYAAYTGLAALWAQKIAHVPTVLSLVGRDATPGPGTPEFWPWYAKQIARRVSHMVTLSEFSRAYYAVEALPASVIPYGVDTHVFAPGEPDQKLRDSLGIGPDMRVLFSLQRLEPVKHVEVAIDALNLLVRSGMEDTVLLIGGTGRARGQLNRQVAEKGLKEHVRFLEFVSKEALPRYYALADIFVFPSIFETFGIVLLEAMAAGLPVVAASASAVPELVIDGLTGFLSEPLSPESMANRLRILLENEPLRREMGQAARERAVKCYDWDKLVIEYEDLFRTCIDNARGRS